MIKLLTILIAFCFNTSLLYASQIDELKWHLNPVGQNILIELDDLHSEYIQASPSLNLNFEQLQKMNLKRKVKVAVIDSGIDHTHPQLKSFMSFKSVECLEDNIIPAMSLDHDGNELKNDCLGWNFANDDNNIEDTDGHGTHVAGIISDFFKGSDHLEILPLKIFSNDDKKPLPIKLGAALEYALAEKVDLIHLSMGWPESLMSIKLTKLIQKILDQGIIIVAASGNSSQRANIYPCKIDGVICVGALRANGEVAAFSNYGPQVDFMAPGERILSTIPLNINPVGLPLQGYDYKSGTSQAAPFISGALLFLKSLRADLSASEVTHLLKQNSQTSNSASFGYFNLLAAASDEVSPSLTPSLKGLNTINISTQEELTFFINNDFNTELTSTLTLSCGQEKVLAQTIRVEAFSKKKVHFKPNVIKKSSLELKCSLTLDTQNYNFTLRVLNAFENEALDLEINESKIILPTRKGVRSKLISIPLMKGYKRNPLYYLLGEESLILYHLNKRIGTVSVDEGCKKLRVLQVDFNKDGENDILFEQLCESKYLKYQFLDNELNPIYPQVEFTPKLSIINYNDFYFEEKNGLPSLLYINNGYTIPSSDPWETNNSGRSRHVYELYTILVDGKYLFKESILDNEKSWAKQLGLRYTPNFQILNLLGEIILFKFSQKYYFYNLKTKLVSVSSLNDLLIQGDTYNKVLGNDLYSLNTLITPYDFRSALTNGVVLRANQDNYSDPFMSVIAIQAHSDSYSAYVKSFMSMYQLKFDLLGNLIERKKFKIERFDFLNGDELDALVTPIIFEDQVSFLIDGTKIHTNYIDLIHNERESFMLPDNCSTQLPVIHEGVNYLVFSCIKDRQAILKLIPAHR